jgi:PD-(D/E)XK nuclease superfamily protein
VTKNRPVVEDTGNLTHLPVSGPLRSPRIDFSSLQSLASCQWRWHARYVLGLPDRPGTAAMLGTLMGDLTAIFWEGGDWRAYLEQAEREWVLAGATGGDEDAFATLPEWMGRAAWLMARYEEHYGEELDSVKVLGTEMFFRLKLPHRYGYLVGKIDQLWEIDGRVWVRECKTMSDWSKMDQHERSHQTTFYMWAARQMGYEPWGILLDGIRTFQWKRDVHPPADSFERRWLDRGEVHMDNCIREADKGLKLAREIISGRLEPFRNINDHCQWCSYRNECNADLGHSDLVVPESFEFEGA